MSVSNCLIVPLYLREKYPEHVIEQQPGEKKGGDLEAGKSDKGYERDTEAHPHEVHQGPVSSENPDTDHADGDCHGEDFCQREPSADPERYLAFGGAGSDQVLAHGQEEEGQGHGGDHCGAHGEQELEGARQRESSHIIISYLHGVEEEKHNQQRE